MQSVAIVDFFKILLILISRNRLEVTLHLSGGGISDVRNLTDYQMAFRRVALMLLLTYLFMGWCNPLRTPSFRGKRQIAMIQVKEMENALKLYRIDLGRFPTTGEGLAALIRNPGKSLRWLGPYLNKARIPSDPWGRSYFYRCPGLHGDYDMFTLGADGIEGGSGDNADITNWETAELQK